MLDQINEPKKSNTLLISIVVVAVLVVATYTVFHYIKKTDTPVVVDTPQNINTTGNTTSSIYKDGMYTSVGTYNSPGGAEQITVSLTLKDDVVVDAVVTSDATRPESKKYQYTFISNYKAFVVGKNLSTLNLSKVSGSSLTPKGFNDAVLKIQAQAKA